MNSTLPLIEPERLAAVPLFKGLLSADLQALINQAHQRRMESGGFFFFQEDPSENIYALISGRVKLIQCGPEGEQVLMQIAGPYSLFGAVALTHIPGYPVSAQAAEDSCALFWTREQLMPAVASHPTLAMNAIQMMSSHAREFQERFRQVATQRVERRLASTLLKLASQAGQKTSDGVRIDIPLTRQDLAEMTGTTLFTVSRLLKQWEERGLVASRREQVTIRFPHGLVVIAEDLSDSQTN